MKLRTACAWVAALAVWLISNAHAAVCPQVTVPRALRASAAARLALRNGVLELRITKHIGGSEVTKNYYGQFAGTESVLTCLGDDEGIVIRDTTGAPSTTSTQSPKQFLRSGSRIWAKEAESTRAELFEGGYAAPDYRALGLMAGLGSETLEEALERDVFDTARIRSFSETAEGDVRIVSATYVSGNVVRWWIDSKKGWSVTRCTLESGGRVILESRSELRQFGDGWYPARTIHTAGGAFGEKPPLEVFEVSAVEFNRPDLPETLTPESIGIVPNVTPITRFASAVPGGPMTMTYGFFDGATYISSEEYLARGRAASNSAERGGVASPSPPSVAAPHKSAVATPRPVAVAAAPPSSQPAVAIPPESEWESYTRRFIAQHQLDEGQTNAALAILKQCQERAGKYMQTKSDEFRQLAADVAENDRIAPVSPERSAKLARRRAELRAPIDEIFEKDLRPRLEKLLTPKQREAARPAQPRK